MTAVRKVRTAKGSRFYGLPIGAPITADVIAKARGGGSSKVDLKKAPARPATSGGPVKPAAAPTGAPKGAPGPNPAKSKISYETGADNSLSVKTSTGVLALDPSLQEALKAKRSAAPGAAKGNDAPGEAPLGRSEAPAESSSVDTSTGKKAGDVTINEMPPLAQRQYDEATAEGEVFADPKKREAATKAFQETLDQQRVALRMRPETIDLLLRDGRIKTLHETGTSGGMTSTDFRSSQESLMFSGEGLNPISAYMTGGPGADEDTARILSRYGKARVILKDSSVRKRTTVTGTDSLSAQTQPSPLTDVSFSTLPLSEIDTTGGDVDTDVRSSLKKWQARSYVEAQIHGGVTLDDIERIEFPGGEGNQDFNDEMRTKLEAAGVQFGEYTTGPGATVQNYDAPKTSYKNVDEATKGVYGAAVAVEPKLTALMNDFSSRHGMEMIGLDFRLKTEDSLRRKIEFDQKDTGDTFDETAATIRDAVRYTMQGGNDDLVSNMKAVLEDFKARNFKIRAKNTWKPGSPYKGVNVILTDEDGYNFELQFHTEVSLVIKEINHKLYEEERVLDRNDPRRAVLSAQMREYAASIPDPPGIYDFEFEV